MGDLQYLLNVFVSVELIPEFLSYPWLFLHENCISISIKIRMHNKIDQKQNRDHTKLMKDLCKPYTFLTFLLLY